MNEPLIIVFGGVSCNASIVFDVMNELVIIQWASISGKCECECSINNFTKQWLTLAWSLWRNLLLADANINNLTILSLEKNIVFQRKNKQSSLKIVP